ncbi:MAG TPA: TolC family protein [Methylomirabilota bacterium]|nr:TolC family protein [Methylomirabilota bacterium]
MNLKRCAFTFTLFALPFVSHAAAQSRAGAVSPSPVDRAPSNEQRPRLTFNDYLNEVLRANLDLAVQRANIAISQAGVTSASVSPDWSADFGAPLIDLSGQGNPTTYSVGLNAPVELGGKRGHRIRSARADLASVTSDYDDAVRQLRAAAAGAFIDALGTRAILQSKEKSLGQFDRIVTVNEERLRVGEIGDIELVQSRVNRDQFKADVITALADVYGADLVLGQQLGKPERFAGQLPVPDGTLETPIRAFDVAQLVATALERRPDVQSKQRAVKAADLRIELAHVNLIPDITVSGSYSHLAAGSGGFTQPADNTLAASLSVSLPFSRWQHRGELEGARATRTQAELQLRSTQLAVETEVRDAYSRYQAAVQHLQLYRGGMLKDADRVLEARLYAYQRGGATLLEVIDAQRTSADIYLAYAQALVDHAHALITLEQAAAIWDVSF